ncbi:MAG: hypothetical protein RIB98_09505 [Acidimicrobiales bacterium]
MIDFGKKITKSCGDDLEPGETVLAGTFVQPAGAIRRQVAYGAIGGVIGAVVSQKAGEKRANETPTAEEGIVIDIPPGKAVLGLTDRRLLVFGHSAMTGRPKGLNAAIPLDQVAGVTHESGKLTGKLLVSFADGTSIDFDVVKTAKPGPFVDAFHATTGR